MNKGEKALIKDVAIYIRKSRANETKKDLENHKSMLIKICEDNNWNYKDRIYHEVKSGASIEVRPEMQNLLKSVELGLYDAVLVVDQDRLSRGKGADTDYIKRIFKKSKTYICIGNKVMNLNDDNDDTLYEFNAFFAKLEYKTITKRLRRGKILRAMRGYWTNGIPPFPYDYKREDQIIEVNPEQVKLYEMILDMYINQNLSTNEIAYTLNKKEGKQYRTKNGKYWSNKTIADTLKDETHLGKIIIGKTKGNAHLNKPSDTDNIEYIDKKDWLILDGKHQAIKTQEQHNQIMFKMQQNSKLPFVKISKAKTILPLTGLMVCGVCGYSVGLMIRKDTQKPYIKKCHHKNEFGEKCPNMGCNLEPIIDSINAEIIKYDEQLRNEVDNSSEIRKMQVIEELKDIKNAIKTQEEAIDRIDDAFEDGTYTKEKYKERINKVNKKLFDLEQTKKNLETELILLQENDNSKIKVNIGQFLKDIQDNNLTYEEQNELYKTVIKSIVYKRTDEENIEIKIEYR